MKVAQPDWERIFDLHPASFFWHSVLHFFKTLLPTFTQVKWQAQILCCKSYLNHLQNRAYRGNYIGVSILAKRNAGFAFVDQLCRPSTVRAKDLIHCMRLSIVSSTKINQIICKWEMIDWRALLATQVPCMIPCCAFRLIKWESDSTISTNRKRDEGSPWQIPLVGYNTSNGLPFTKTEYETVEINWDMSYCHLLHRCYKVLDFKCQIWFRRFVKISEMINEEGLNRFFIIRPASFFISDHLYTVFLLQTIVKRWKNLVFRSVVVSHWTWDLAFHNCSSLFQQFQ